MEDIDYNLFLKEKLNTFDNVLSYSAKVKLMEVFT